MLQDGLISGPITPVLLEAQALLMDSKVLEMQLLLLLPGQGRRSAATGRPSLSQRSPAGPQAPDSIKEGGQNDRQAWNVVSQHRHGQFWREITHIPFPEPVTPEALVWPCTLLIVGSSHRHSMGEPVWMFHSSPDADYPLSRSFHCPSPAPG